MAERFVVPRKPGHAGEGRNLSSRQTHDVVGDLEIGALYDKISRDYILAHAYAQCRKTAPWCEEIFTMIIITATVLMFHSASEKDLFDEQASLPCRHLDRSP